MQSYRILEDQLGLRIGAICEILKSSLQHVPVSKGDSEALNLVGHLVHPDVVERLSFLHHLCLQNFTERFDLIPFPAEDEVLQSFKVADAWERGDLRLEILAQLRQVMNLLLRVSEDVFDDLLHEDAVVALRRHARVRSEDTLGDDAAEEEARASRALSADR